MRPGIWRVGALSKNSEKRSLSKVAEEMMTFRSLRLRRMRFRMPKRKSMFRERSWASSMMIVS